MCQGNFFTLVIDAHHEVFEKVGSQYPVNVGGKASKIDNGGATSLDRHIADHDTVQLNEFNRLGLSTRAAPFNVYPLGKADLCRHLLAYRGEGARIKDKHIRVRQVVEAHLNKNWMSMTGKRHGTLEGAVLHRLTTAYYLHGSERRATGK
jgi:hypothetical protein